jgi:hypothetical protein
MTARFFSTMMLFALAMVVSGRLTAQKMIDARSFVPPRAPSGSVNPRALIKLENDLGELYAQIVPERSLLIYDCGKDSVWCGNEDYSFASTFTKAAAVAGIAADSAASLWYKDAASYPTGLSDSVAPWTGVPKDRFQMLAIVNRMDLATWSPTDSRWTGAEVRFVYGLQPDEKESTLQNREKFTVILEFTLAARDWAGFQRLAQKWMDLSKMTPQKFLIGLKEAIAQSGIEQSTVVRMRTNRDNVGPRWEMSQYEFLPKKGFAAAPLTDQLNSDYARAGNAAYEKYVKLWKGLPGNSKRESIIINSGLLASPKIRYTNQSLSMPEGACNQFSGPEFTRDRNILALQQCTGCHTNETNTCFQHITNRLRNGSSQLSKFLVGNNPRPTIHQLGSTDTAAVYHVTVPYEVEAGTASKACSYTPAPPADRYFHDLGRRALFLAAVLGYKAQTPENVKIIEMFKANFSH